MAVSRRHFLKATATGAAAAILPLGAARAQAAFKLDYILASSLYGQLPLKDILPEVAKAGATHIDLWPKKHGSQREELDAMGEEAFLALLAEHQVKPGILTRYDLGPYKLLDEVKLAGRIGARLVIAASGGGGSEGPDLKGRIQGFIEKIKPTVDAAEEAGVTVGIENHGNALIQSPDSMRYFAELATSPALGIAYAPYHLPQDPALQAGLIRDLGPKVSHFYAWEHGFGSTGEIPKAHEMQQLPGFGQFDFIPVLQAFKEIEYSGWTSVFMHPIPRGIPILPTIEESTAALNRSRAYLEDCLGKLT
ncbi:MAG: sugar phosphate isomerase/epimerase [Candidatus Hydrogenedentes bacterium]|nr:sugar phosphate isomerase/epimerase [Candidatus Hydrogenedentota bacterium]